MNYEIFTDGSVINNGKNNAKASFGICIKFKDSTYHEINGLVSSTYNQSNNTGELSGIYEALNYMVKSNLNKKPIKIYTDSKYCINSVTNDGECWHIKWVKNNWKNSSNKPVVNTELIKLILDIIKKFSNLKFVYVASHTRLSDSASLGNERADFLAKQALGLRPL